MSAAVQSNMLQRPYTEKLRDKQCFETFSQLCLFQEYEGGMKSGASDMESFHLSSTNDQKGIKMDVLHNRKHVCFCLYVKQIQFLF